MEDVTLSPTMGEYLDMRNNDKANPATDTRANENYARELMQLFTIGLFQLNQDGTPATGYQRQSDSHLRSNHDPEFRQSLHRLDVSDQAGRDAPETQSGVLHRAHGAF